MAGKRMADLPYRIRIFIFLRLGVDFLSQGVVNNNLPVMPEMYRRRESEFVGLKGVKVRVTPSKGGSISEIIPAWMCQSLSGFAPYFHLHPLSYLNF
jgi:hypothetical protein